MLKKTVVAMGLGLNLLIGGAVSGVADIPVVEAGRVGNITYDESSVYMIENDEDGFVFNIAVNVDGRGSHIYHYSWKNGNDTFWISMDNYNGDSMAIYGTGSVKDVFRAIFYKYRGYSIT